MVPVSLSSVIGGEVAQQIPGCEHAGDLEGGGFAPITGDTSKYTYARVFIIGEHASFQHDSSCYVLTR